MTSTDTLLQSHRVRTRRRSLTGWHSPPVEGWQAKLDGVVVPCLHPAIPLLRRGGRRSLTGWLCRVYTRQFPSCGGEMTSTDTLLQSHRVRTRRRSLTGWHSPPVEGWQAKLDGVVVPCLHPAIPLLWRGGKRSLTGWLCRVCTRQFPSCGGEMTSTDTLLQSHRVRTRRRSLTGWCLRTHPTYENR